MQSLYFGDVHMVTFIHSTNIETIDAYVNPVNCVGDLSKLLYPHILTLPELISIYTDLCFSKKFIPGIVQVIKNIYEYPKYILNLPTRFNGTDIDNLSYIKSGINVLPALIVPYHITRLGIPVLSDTIAKKKIETIIIQILSNTFMNNTVNLEIVFLY